MPLFAKIDAGGDILETRCHSQANRRISRELVIITSAEGDILYRYALFRLFLCNRQFPFRRPLAPSCVIPEDVPVTQKSFNYKERLAGLVSSATMNNDS